MAKVRTGIRAGVLALAGLQLRVVFVESIRDVLQEDEAEADVLVLGRVHVVPQFVSGESGLRLEAEVGGGRFRFLGPGHGIDSASTEDRLFPSGRFRRLFGNGIASGELERAREAFSHWGKLPEPVFSAAPSPPAAVFESVSLRNAKRRNPGLRSSQSSKTIPNTVPIPSLAE